MGVPLCLCSCGINFLMISDDWQNTKLSKFFQFTITPQNSVTRLQ